MKTSRSIIDVNDELILCKHNAGVKLINPNNSAPSLCTVPFVMSLPCNVYFLSRESKIQRLNETNARAICADSPKAAIGKTSLDYLRGPGAELIVQNDIETVKTEKLKVVEEDGMRADGVVFNGLTIKMPWYDDNNNVIGVFGYSISFATQSLAGTISQIVDTGTFNFLPNPVALLPGRNILDVYLSKRETEIVKYTIRGKSAKIIAKILEISPRTVEQHLENIKLKLGVSSKAELIEKVFDHCTF